MYDYLVSVFLGVVEGLTEFLPVSSTAHLRICEVLLHIDLHDGFWKMYTIVIQFGAILALPVYFWHRIVQFVRTFPKGEHGNRTIFTHPLSLTLIAFVVTAIPAWALAKVIGKNLESIWVMALALLIGGIIMWIVDTVFTRPRTMHMEEMNSAAGGMDRRSTNSLRCFSRHVALDVHYRCRADRRHVSSGRARIFVFSVDANDGSGDRL